MAISRMQQPRQMYGLGSFVKKLTRKVTRPFTKVAKKIVPKEIAGIMRVAAPFLPPQFRTAAYLLGTAKQTGRISPIDLALVAAPRIGRMKIGGQSITDRLGALDVPFTGGKDLREVLVGAPEFKGINESIQASPMGRTTVLEGVGAKDATSGIFGKGGKMFQFGVKDSPKILDTKAGQFLLGGEDDKFSKAKLAGVGVGVLSLIQNSKTPDEAGTALVAATGDSDDYERGFQLFSQIKPELFRVPEEFRMNVKGGGRIGFDKGTSDPARPRTKEKLEGLSGLIGRGLGGISDVKDFGNMFIIITSDGKQIITPKERNLEDEGIIIIDPKSFDNDMFLDLNLEKPTKADGGLMRTNYAMGAGEKGVVNPFQPKPQGPVLPEEDKPFKPKPLKPIKMAEFDLKDYMEEFERVFPEMKEKRGTQEYMDMLEDYFRGLAAKEAEGIMMAKEGGRANLALGTKPTPEESGLGGLPIEADMRYTGGFMPYGEKEKADDVPARLSKNEFVFTADAVRAAGGGSVNEGAKKMYATMKQLEAKPEAKGMMA